MTAESERTPKNAEDDAISASFEIGQATSLFPIARLAVEKSEFRSETAHTIFGFAFLGFPVDVYSILSYSVAQRNLQGRVL